MTKKEQVYSYIMDNPGKTLQEIHGEFSDLSYAAISNHISKLHLSGKIYSVKRHWYPLPSGESVDNKTVVQTETPHVVAKTLDKYTGRELLAELKSRGYIWDNMYVKQCVEYSKI